MLFICLVLIIIIVNWFHLDFNSVKSSVYSATYQKINIRYLKFNCAVCFCFSIIFAEMVSIGLSDWEGKPLRASPPH